MIEWKEVNTQKPDLGDFIIVCNEKVENLRKGHFGICFPTADEKHIYFQLGRDQLDKPEKWKYWTPLLIELDAPDNDKPEELNTFYEYSKYLLNTYEARFLLVVKTSASASKNMYAMDSYVSGIVSRSLSLIYGFTTLLESKNFMAAAHLCRLHLDNYLRLYAAWLTPNPHDFAMAVLSGKRVEELTDRDGKQMKDWYLREKANKDKPWVSSVYKETSGYIHFSRKHIMSNSTISKDKEGVIETYLSKYDHDNVKVSNRIEGVLGMIEISNAILEYIVGWVFTKMNEDKLDALKKKQGI
jgi:hypothetical protein